MDQLTLEAGMAKELGLERELLSRVRRSHFKEGVDFVRTPAGIGLVPAAVGRMLEILAALETEAKPAVAGEERVLVVVRTVPNPGLVLARLDTLLATEKDGGLVTLRVPMTRTKEGKRGNFFRAGMRVKARFQCGAVWAFAGAPPRYLGDVRSLAREKVAAARPAPAAGEVQP